MSTQPKLEKDLDHLRKRLQQREAGQPSSEERLRGLGFFEAMVRSLPEAVAVLRDGRHVHCNGTWARLFGFEGPAQLAGLELGGLLEPDDAARLKAHLEDRDPAGQRAWSLELKGRTPQGAVLDLELTGQGFRQGGTTYVAASAHDLRMARRAEEALRRNEWGWKHLFQMSLVGMAMVGTDGRFLAVNGRLCDLLGETQEAVLAKSWLELVAAEDRDAAGELFGVLLSGRASGVPVELKVLRADGEAAPVLVNAHAIFRPDGRPEQILALVQDLTAQKAVQGQLSATQNVARLLGAAVEQSPASIVITDREGTIQYVNPTFVRATGYSAEEAKGNNPRILKSGLQGPEVYRDMWTALTAGRTWTGSLANRRKDGSLLWEKASISPIVEGGETTHYLAVKEDITRSREMELSNRRLLSALEFTDEAVGVCSIEGEIIHANKAFQRILGCTCTRCPDPGVPAEQCRLRTFFQGPGRELLAAVAAGELKTGQTLRRNASWTPDLERKGMTLAVSASLVQSPDGDSQDLLIVCRDVTHDLELEGHLRHMEKMEALGTLVGGITHDFNNVLTAIQSAAELLEWQLPEDSPARSKLSVILQAAGRARELNRQILAFSRPTQERKLPFDLSALVKECVHLLRNTLPRDLEVRTAIASSLWAMGDPAQLHQVLMNLGTNAMHAVEGQRGVLEFGLAEAEDPRGEAGAEGAARGVLLTVRDNGCGMDADTLKRACEPFFSTREPGKGTGLGLSVVHGIVQGHGGHLRMDSTPGRGTEVQVWLPSTTDPTPATKPAAGEILRGQGHILLVDLEEIRIALSKEALQGLGYRVTAKSDPMEALQAFREHPAVFDLVMLEYSSGSISAEDLAQRMRRLRKDLPVLLVSGSLATQVMSAAEVQAGPFDHVLCKPFGLKDLAAAVHGLLQTRAAAATADPVLEGPAAARGGRVLIAEDSAVTLSMLKGWMTKAGYEVVTARDGQEAWEALRREGVGAFALVLSDVVMPRMDGLQLVELVRELDAEVPVVLLSSSEDLEAMKAAVHLQVNEFLTKPFDSSVLLACANRMMSGAGARARSAQTAQAVRMAQKAMVAMPEKDLPVYSVHQSLTDAGGDVFRCIRQGDGSILFLLADVAGHSVISSYAVAAFLGLLTSLPLETLALSEIAARLNRGIQQGPFSEVPVCVLLGRWTPASGRLHLLNAGLPHGVLARASGGCGRIELNGTPLGIFDTPMLEEKVLQLEEGDRMLFGSDGIFDLRGSDNRLFDELVSEVWCQQRETGIADAVTAVGVKAQAMAQGRLEDDLLLVGFAQPRPAIEDLRLRLPSTAEAIDAAAAELDGFLAHPPRAIPLTHSRRFDIVTAAREALTNAVFHGNQANAERTVWMTAGWQAHPPALHLKVLDEGQGFDLAALAPPADALSERGRGIPYLRHCAGRVQMEGGELSLEFRWED